MKLTLAEPKVLKDCISIISDLVSETKITVKQDLLEIVSMDPANVAMILFRMKKSLFAEYEIQEETTISINLNSFKQILRRVKPKDVLTLEQQENKLKIVMKSSSVKTYYLPLIELDDREQRIPSLDFKSVVHIASSNLSEVIDDVDVVGESISFETQDNKFKVSSAGDMTKVDIVYHQGEEVDIKSSENHKSKYSVEYLKKMIQGSKISDKAIIKFSNDYPLSLSFDQEEVVSLSFILAPRVDQD